MKIGEFQITFLDSHVCGKRRKWWIFHRSNGLMYIAIYRFRIVFRWRKQEKRCKNCKQWFSTYKKAFKGMDCHKPKAGHCLRTMYDQHHNPCSEKKEYYVPATKRKFWRPR